MKLSRIVLIAMILMSVIGVYLRYVGVNHESNQNIEYLSNLYAERVKSVVLEAAEVTEVLVSLLVANKGHMSESEIDTMMKLAYRDDSHIAIAYMPDGVITKAYPLKGNEASIGYDVFEDIEARTDAITAMQTRKIAFSGPYMLMIGTPGLVARNPVYFELGGEEIFWGFVAAIIRPSSDALLINTGLTNLDDLQYEYSVQSNYNGNHINLYSSKNFDQEHVSTSHKFSIGQDTWQIHMYKNGHTYYMAREMLIASFAAIAFTILIYLAFRQSEQKQSVAHTQSLTDSLTNLYNRRALDKYEERRNNHKSEGYTIFYLDLNKFKPVNDNFGHHIGDKLLAIFAERLLAQFRKDTFISRVGGDEFVIVFPLEQDKEQCIHVQSRLIRISEDPFFIDGHEINISSSIGCASFPKDGSSFSEVLSKADKEMFAYKELHRKQER